MDSRRLLLALSLKFSGDWDLIYDVISKKRDFDIDEVNTAELKIKSKYVTILDSEYPEILKKVYKPPFVLYYYGDISLLRNTSKCISVVGSRLPSEYGARMCREIVSGLIPEKIIVSGLAKGIDAIAHKTCIENGGRTVAVLGSGLDYCYPSENRYLYREIKKNHLLISEYPNDTSPEPACFPFRNRLVAAFGEATLVVEAAKHSGTLTTVSYALLIGKDVYCVPQQAGIESACNHLIKEGAALVENSDDVLYELSKNLKN